MKTFIVFFVAMSTMCVAQTQSPTQKAPQTAPAAKSKKKLQKPAVAPLQPITIPPGATKTNDGYRYVAADGKVWIYRETPFGVTKAPEVLPVQPAATPTAAQSDVDKHVTATADGDVIHFERETPFGKTKWQKNKNELTAEEEQIWQRSQAPVGKQ